MKQLYTTSVQATGGRDGCVKSDDGILNLEVRSPRKLGGVDGYTNPEQLFAAGYAACFDSALSLIMRRERIRPGGPSTVWATVSLNSDSGGSFSLEVALKVFLPGVEKSAAEKLVAKAHQVCPYSNATRGNIDVQLEVVDAFN